MLRVLLASKMFFLQKKNLELACGKLIKLRNFFKSQFLKLSVFKMLRIIDEIMKRGIETRKKTHISLPLLYTVYCS